MKTNFNSLLYNKCKEKNNWLCLGLDIDPDFFNNSISDPIDFLEKFAFEIIDSTIDIVPVYKPNLAFFERYGYKGFKVFEKIVEYIDGRSIVIADAKRGDIGNTCKYYASAMFDEMGCDAITVNPYMGSDSILPFLKNKFKGVFVLCLTSNSSSGELQNDTNDNTPLFLKVAKLVGSLNKNGNLGLVVGATKSDFFDQINKYCNKMPYLIPGVGHQGGDLEESLISSNKNGYGIINVSRSIINSGKGNLKSIRSAALSYTEKIREVVNGRA
ncbi:MAG: orotidine-5'-phosphate decarboxylase [bacterium TMED198]|nr:MAG: orotidine-5'-phosphate decarboxylase [bacterium TMED198]